MILLDPPIQVRAASMTDCRTKHFDDGTRIRELSVGGDLL
jgi:hypothetical protein